MAPDLRKRSLLPAAAALLLRWTAGAEARPTWEVGATLQCVVVRAAADSALEDGAAPSLIRCGDFEYEYEPRSASAATALGLTAKEKAAKEEVEKEKQEVEREIASEAESLPVGSAEWYCVVAQAFCCVVCAAIAAGLTLGLTSIDEFELQIKLNTFPEDVLPNASAAEREKEIALLERDQACARRILPLIASTYFGCKGRSDEDGVEHAHGCDPTNSHYLLVTLLLLNATANEALPLFLDRLVPAWLAVLLSVSVVLVFGEIIPSAIFTGPNQLPLAAALSPLVRCAKVVFLPVVWPISLLLDKCLGHSDSGFSKAQIKGVVRALRAQGNEILVDEANMIHGVLEMHHKTARDVAKDLDSAKMIPHDAVLSMELMKQLDQWGHSRCLVHRGDSRSDVMKVLLIKKLVTIDADLGIRCIDATRCLKEPVVLSPDENLLETLNKFQDGACHLAVLSDDPAAVREAWATNTPIPEAARPKQFVSLEDVIEQLLKEEIFDEDDVECGRDMTGQGSNPVSPIRIQRQPSAQLLVKKKYDSASQRKLQKAATEDRGGLRQALLSDES